LPPILQLTKHQQLTQGGARLTLNCPQSKIPTGKQSSECGRLAVACAQSLIRARGLDLKDWRDTWEAFANSEIYHPRSSEFQSLLNPSEAAVAALPSAMFFHENKAKLREKIMLAIEVWPNENKPEWETAILAVGYAIARTLKNKLDPATAIEQTIAYLKTDNALTELLLQVQILLQRGADLETATTHLCKSATEARERQGEGREKITNRVNCQPRKFDSHCLSFLLLLEHPRRLALVSAAGCSLWHSRTTHLRFDGSFVWSLQRRCCDSCRMATGIFGYP
jgi:hypothetical protein